MGLSPKGGRNENYDGVAERVDAICAKAGRDAPIKSLFIQSRIERSAQALFGPGGHAVFDSPLLSTERSQNEPEATRRNAHPECDCD
jgi:hypothetical protein